MNNLFQCFDLRWHSLDLSVLHPLGCEATRVPPRASGARSFGSSRHESTHLHVPMCTDASNLYSALLAATEQVSCASNLRHYLCT